MISSDEISSARNPTFKAWKKLVSSKKARQLAQQTLLDGTHIIEVACQQGLPIQQWIVAQSAQHRPDIRSMLQQQRSPVTHLTDPLFAALTDLVTPTGIMALIRLPLVSAIKRSGHILALEGVQDPGNVGTIVRAAAAFGISQVWLDAHCADLWSPKVLRAAMGAHFVVECVTQVDLSAALRGFVGTTVATLCDPSSRSLAETDLAGDNVLVVGNEGTGISALLREQIDITVTIPMQPGVESLNVGAATAICLYERYRQQQHLISG